MDIGLDLEFLPPEGKNGPAKATVHRTGRLGFSQGAHVLIDFEKNKLFKLARLRMMGGETYNNDVLIMLPVRAEDEMTFTIQRSGDYYSLKTKRLLNQMNIDFRNERETITFDVDEVIDKDKKYYKLIRRKMKTI